ncbi:unnamed protein product [Phaedon cochleariae]|uniref:RING-type E3 ubiquitin transferase n=1 Tax=Phaedon cochleariae TaxID=80249 RepID=A0A9P0DCS3_PHACE|nr:unnamed protein product [Phaedon cochleariae]
MMQKPCIPLSVIKDLICRQCQNFVSCGPVYVLPSSDTILCGRCRYLAKNVYQNKAYEALASMFLYPCCNWTNHCSRSLKWDESLQHEDQCTYSGCCSRFWLHPTTLCRRRREMPCGDIRLVAVPDHLLDHIKCVICQSYLTCEPVFIQPNGTNICHRCVHSNGVPPNCLRNYLYEQLSSIIIFPCVFRNRGCPTRLKFGKDLWQHESQCSYNQMFRKSTPKPGNQKEKGVIQTHSGHYYGTITPHSAPFAPPAPHADFDANMQLLKSLKNKQERKFVRAEEIGSSMGKVGSEDGSSSDYDVDRGSSYDKSSLGVPGTPTRIDEPDIKERPNNHQHAPQRDSGYYSSSVTRANSGSIAPVHPEYENVRVSRNNSYNQQHIPGFLSQTNITPERAQEVIPRNINYSNIGFQNTEGLQKNQPSLHLDYSLLAGHYPIFSNKGDGGDLQHRPSSNGGGMMVPKPIHLMRTDSLSSNKDLMDELKRRQSFLKSKKILEKSENNSPYEACQSLDDVLQVHDKIGQ